MTRLGVGDDNQLKTYFNTFKNIYAKNVIGAAKRKKRAGLIFD